MGNMRVFLRGLFVVGLVAALCTYGLAAGQSANRNQGAAAQKDGNQPPPSATAQQQTPSSQMAPAGQAMQGMMLQRTSDIIGKQVKSSQGDNLGVIHDIVLTSDYQQVSYVALSSGGVFGINSRLYAVPWQALQVSSKGDITTSISKDQIKQSSGFTNTSWPSQPDMRLMSAAGTTGSSSTGSSSTGASAAGSSSTNSAIGGQASANQSQAGQSQSSSAAAGQMAAGGQDAQMLRVTHLTGTEVRNPDNQDLGDIEDFAINTSDGHIVYDIISYGGVAGIGEKYAAVPANAVRIQPQNHVAIVNATRQTLDSVAFKAGDMSTLTSSDYLRRAQQAFPPAPAGAALGYVPSQSPQAQQAASDKAWAADSPSSKSFNPGSVKTIKGTVQSVGSFKPEGAAAGAAGGLRLRVKTSDGNTVTVHAGPISYAEQNNFFVMPGDEITITGSESKMGSRSVVMASELKKGSQTLQLRDKTGKPLWTAGQSPSSGSQNTRTGSSQKSGAAGQSSSGQSKNQTPQQ